MKRKKLIAVLLMWLGLMAAVGLGLLVLGRNEPDSPPVSTALLVGLGVAIVLFFAIGLNMLLSIKRQDESGPPTSYRHAVPLLALIAALLVLVFVGRWFAVPATFGQHGQYRGAAIAEARSFSPRHIDEKICEECHEAQASLHSKDVHVTVQCGTCHGAGWKHAENPQENPVQTPDGKEQCLVCHELLEARPASFPQIRWREHFLFVGIKDESVTCINCHDPHEPLYMERNLRSARLHPLVHRCRDCHVGRVDEKLTRPAKHPAIFECNYCHSAAAEDFEDRAHSKVRCTTCHLFLKETAYAGRIIRDADPRFCLLCHRQAEFRSDSAPPGIDWPGHRDDMSSGPADDTKRCIDCHRDAIHAPSEPSPPAPPAESTEDDTDE
jgi:hypothetical protein